MGAWEIEPSERIVLECGCGERLVLLGREGDWHAEGRSDFTCQCGNKLTFADRAREKGRAVVLIRGLGISDRQ